MLSYGYAVSIGDQLEPYGVLNPAAYQLIGKVFHQIKERKTWAHPSKALVEAALINEMAQNILEAIDTLEYKPIRYDQVRTAIDKAEALNQEEYKDFSRVAAAVKAVVWDKNVTEQADVDAMAKAIEDAVAALEYKPADYSGVDAAIGKAEALNREEYKDFSRVAAAVKAVVWDKNVTEQADVDAMAKAIEDAIAALEYKRPITAEWMPPSGRRKL